MKAAPLKIYVFSKPSMVSPPARQPAEAVANARAGDVVVETEAAADEAAAEDVEEKTETDERVAENESERLELGDAVGDKLRASCHLKFLARIAV